MDELLSFHILGVGFLFVGVANNRLVNTLYNILPVYEKSRFLELLLVSFFFENII